MGTNYYYHEQAPCPCCGREYEPLHIGKSSGGWCFSLHVIPEKGINNLEDWRERWETPGSYISNEYGDSVALEEMLKIITQRKWRRQNGKGDLWSQKEYDRNHAVPGPNGLVRHKIGRWCIGHGEGTWDLIPGEFS